MQDRTLYEDPEIFAKYLHGLGHMTNAELDLYFEYFQRLTAKHRQAGQGDLLRRAGGRHAALAASARRGREEEKGIQTQFLRGLNGYYAIVPAGDREQVRRSTASPSTSPTMDIRAGKGREEFLDKVTTFLAA